MSSSRNEPLPAQVEKTGMSDVNGGPAAPSWRAALVTMVAVQTATAFLSRVPPTLAPRSPRSAAGRIP